MYSAEVVYPCKQWTAADLAGPNWVRVVHISLRCVLASHARSYTNDDYYYRRRRVYVVITAYSIILYCYILRVKGVVVTLSLYISICIGVSDVIIII